MKKTILAVIIGGPGLVLGLAILLGLLSRPSSVFLGKAPSHGVTFLLRFDPAAATGDTNLVAEFKEAFRRRFERLGTRMYWETPSSNVIRISAPIEDSHAVQATEEFICRAAQLELRLVHPENDDLVFQGLSEPGFELLSFPHKSRNGQQDITGYLVKRKPELTGKYINNVAVTRDTLGRPEINFSLDSQGSAIFAGVTGSNVGRQIAIVLDGKIQSAPVIKDAILGGNVQITGSYSDNEAKGLADALNAPLPAPIQKIDTRRY